MPTPVILTDQQTEYVLGLHMEILEDPGGDLTIEDVASPEFDSQFVPSQLEVPGYGFTNSAYWARLSLRNEARLTDRWLLDVDFANMQFVDLYAPSPSGAGFDVKETGSLRHASTRDIRYPRIVFELTPPGQSEQTYYLRFKSDASMTLGLTLRSPTAFLIDTQQDLLKYGFYFGLMLGLLGYNTFLLLSLRERSYLFLTLFIANMIFFEATYAGYLETIAFPDIYVWKATYLPVSFSLIFVSALLFTHAFLEVQVRNPKLHLVFIAILAVWGVLIILVPFTSFIVLAWLMVPWGIVSLIILLAAGVISLQQGFRPARFFLIAWAGLFVTLTLAMLVRLGLITSTSFTENAYHLGIMWMVVCWSIALADHINLLKSETEEANLELRSGERRLEQILDGMPLGVVVYSPDQRPTYANRRVNEILANPSRGIQPDPSVGRTLAQTIRYFSLRPAGSDQDYPLEDIPVYRALQGERASVDDIEADLIDWRVPLEIWASPVLDDANNVESAVVAFQDISQRKQVEAELAEYRKSLERLVDERTKELGVANERLSQEIVERETLEQLLYQHIEWLTALNQVRLSIGGTADLPQAYEDLSATIMQLVGAKTVFLVRWDGRGEPIETVCHAQQPELIHDLDRIGLIFETDASLRKEIELGKLIHLSADQAAALPAPLGECFREDGLQSLVLAPLTARQSVTGVLGVATPQPKQAFTHAQADLVQTMTHDLAELAQGAQLRDQAQTLVAAEERTRLARDLHDSVTQVLFSASLVAEVLPRIWQRDPDLAMESLKEVRRLTRGALAEMRTLLLELRPNSVLKTPLPELLAQLTEAVTSRTELRFQLHIEQTPGLPDDVHVSLYRIAQEALNNVVKHAQADQVSVTLSTAPLGPDMRGVMTHEVALIIEDDGVGFAADTKSAGHLGLGIMDERAALIDAALSIESKPGHGTRVRVVYSGKEEKTS